MENMLFKADEKKIVFDDYTDSTEEYGTFWVGMCEECYKKHKDILGNRVDDFGSGVCSVKGCQNEADHYVDFLKDEVTFIPPDLVYTIKTDCELWEKLNNKDKMIDSYMYLNECKNSRKNGLYQLILNGCELWYGTLEEINAVVKTMIRRIEKNDFLDE